MIGHIGSLISRVGPLRLRRAIGIASLMAISSVSLAKDVVRLPVPYMRQPDGSTCLPASLCMAMHFMGRCDLTSSTIFDFHKVCRTDRYNVPDLVRQYGLYAFPSWLEHAWTRETIEHELRCGRPVVLGTDCSRAGHFVLAVGYTDDGKVIIHDPANPHAGWSFNGAYTTTTWDKLIWRNGIMLRGEPFPDPPRTISGTLVDSTTPRTLLYGENAVAEFAIKNNGSEPWPDGIRLAAVDAYSSPTAERQSPLAILPGDASATSGTWISASHAAEPSIKNLAPGETAYFSVPLRAPGTTSDNKPLTLRENFNLVDANGRWFSEHWQTGPSNRQIFFRVAIVPPKPAGFALPLVETGQGGKPSLPWKLKNGGLEVLSVASNAPAFPESVIKPRPADENAATTTTVEDDGSARVVAAESETASADSATSPPETLPGPPPGTAVLKLQPSATQEYDVAMVGDPIGTDYRVEAWVYCEVNPVPRGHGYQRAGIFMHDSGQHRPTNKTELENGEFLLMAFDSDDGRIRIGNFANGGIRDSVRESSATKLTESGWHRFAIRTKGPQVTYELDGVELGSSRGGGNWRRGPRRDVALATERDSRAPLQYGDCGVFCWYPDLPAGDERRGLHFAGFRVDP